MLIKDGEFEKAFSMKNVKRLGKKECVENSTVLPKHTHSDRRGISVCVCVERSPKRELGKKIKKSWREKEGRGRYKLKRITGGGC